MQELVINDLRDFYYLTNDLNLHSQCYPVIKAHEESLGGCSCNRKNREMYAKAIYISFIKNPMNEKFINNIKKLKEVNRIIFKNKEDILKEM